MRTISKVLLVVLCSLLARQAGADEGVHFTNSSSELNNIAALTATKTFSPKFNAGSAVWAVLSVPKETVSVGAFSRGHVAIEPGDKNEVTITVSLLNEYDSRNDADGESLGAAVPYEISCSAAN